MTADLATLDPQFRSEVQRLLAHLVVLDDKGKIEAEMRPYCTLRSPWDQAILWRQSRSAEDIEGTITNLRGVRALWIARCLEIVGPRIGKPVTRALPGLSWHQYGLAVDCYAWVKGKVVWDPNHPMYLMYQQEAVSRGLVSGRGWRQPDAPHVQAPAEDSPLGRFNYNQIDQEMARIWGDVEKWGENGQIADMCENAGFSAFAAAGNSQKRGNSADNRPGRG